MVDRESALNILNKEKDYEDELVQTLGDYFLVCLGHCKDCENGDCTMHVTDMTLDEKEVVTTHLTKILNDSQRHSFLFSKLIGMVTQHGEDNY